jgi:hypothetical protein
MIVRQLLTLVLALSLCSVSLVGQLDDVATLRAAARMRVDLLTERLKSTPRTADPGGERRSEVLAELKREVDGFIGSFVPKPDLNALDLQTEVRSLLASHDPNPEYGDRPSAWVGETRSGTALLVTYTLTSGTHDDLPVIRGFRVASSGTFVPVSEAGGDFLGHTIFARQLQSPVSGEIWIIVWGPEQGFNGIKMRFRAYAFDGGSIRTIWSPEDMLNATIMFNESGFTVEHLVKSQVPWQFERVVYVLGTAGPVALTQ